MFKNKRPIALLVAACLLAASAVPAFAAVPDNDDIGSPIVIGAIPYTNSQDTSEATQGPTDPTFCGGAGPTVWYQFTPAADVRLEANTFGSNYDTVLYVGTSDGSGGIDVLGCNDDTDDLQSRVRFNAEAGVTYLVVAGAYWDEQGGSLVFNLDEAPPAGPLNLDVSVHNAGKFLRNGDAAITGSIECSGYDWIYLEVELRQNVGRVATVRGWSDASLACADDSFELAFSPSSGKFAGGRATARVWLEACGDEGCDFRFIETTVRLRR